MTSTRPLIEHFERVWISCESLGWCDGIGVAEYRRVLAEWEAAGHPANIAEFIHVRANIGPWDNPA